jgi:hypothetical protein
MSVARWGGKMFNRRQQMSKLSKLKERAAQAVNRDDDNLGPDRGTMDQEEARIERAKAEARKEAKREKVQQRAEEARERERERVLNDEKSGGGIVSSISSAIETAAESVDTDGQVRSDDLSEAFSTDFDGDGETLANEFGLQSAQRAEREDATFNSLGQELDQTQQQFKQLEASLGGERNPPPREQQPPRSNGLGGVRCRADDPNLRGRRLDRTCRTRVCVVVGWRCDNPKIDPVAAIRGGLT